MLSLTATTIRIVVRCCWRCADRSFGSRRLAEAAHLVGNGGRRMLGRNVLFPKSLDFGAEVGFGAGIGEHDV